MYGSIPTVYTLLEKMSLFCLAVAPTYMNQLNNFGTNITGWFVGV